MSIEDRLIKDARLRILQALDRQVDSRLGHRMMVHELENEGINRSPEWVRTQMREVVALGAARVITDTDAVLVIELTILGKRHIDRQGVVDGILRPQPGE